MPPGRNSPCPCGSNKKYKRCCFSSGKFETTSDVGTELTLEERITIAKTALDLGDLKRACKTLEPLLSMPSPAVNVLVLASSIAMREKNYKQACRYMQQVVKRQPKDAFSQYNYGTALCICGRKVEALQAFERALAINPGLQIVYPNMGHTLRDLGRSAEAMLCYRKVFAQQRVDVATMSQILLSMHLFSQCDHQQLFAMHRQLGTLIEQQNPRFEAGDRPLHKRSKIRIGYLSPRFSREIVGYFFKPVFDHHNRDEFELYLYSLTPRRDQLTEYFEPRSDVWTNVEPLSDVEICQRIVDDEIDILIDLAGHAPENRISVMARKPAPVQLSMLDYFDTTGLQTIDYFVTDSYSSPATSEQRFTEQLLVLGQPRLVYEAPEYAPAVVINTDTARPLVFGSFNRHHKIVPHVIATWSGLLKAVPNSRLLLKGAAFEELQTQEDFQQRFGEHGIAPDRLEFRGKSEHAQMLSEYADMDIALDTFPYNGGLTTCEALWMGTPVLTLSGERVISRQTAGMLCAVGLGEFIADDEQDFVQRGLYWSTHREQLQTLRLQLRQSMADSALTDADAYTRNLEAHLKSIWADKLAAQEAR